MVIPTDPPEVTDCHLCGEHWAHCACRRTPDTMTFLRRALAWALFLMLLPKVIFHASMDGWGFKGHMGALDRMEERWGPILNSIDPEGEWY